MDVTASTSKDYTIGGVPNLFENKTNEEQKDNDEVQKKFVLPPEYDETDTKWTLKYREPAPGLVELIKYSGVYVNADKLAECEKWSSDCNTFARMLLTEIFTENALSICSWNSETTNASDIRGGQARPGLDEHAKNILQKYVISYGQIHNWNRTDLQCIMKGIRQILIDMRRVRGTKKEEEEKGKKCQIDLPPEYDKNNSRWTLKYRAYAPGLVEIIEDSCVYVEASQLDKCKRSDDCITLARMLLNEIFTKSALSTCSWNDPTCKDSDRNDTNVRPGLDKNAMTTLLKFVAEHELKNGWTVTDKNILRKRIRQKLELLRRVARKGEDFNEGLSKKNLRQRIDPPPEYRHVEYGTDTRWTLKYREPASELVELIKDSGVYVNTENLADCIKRSSDPQTLAKMLLTEVFTIDALRICTLSKKNLEVYNIPRCGGISAYLLTLTPRPELDAYAEIIILNFVDEYALEKGWRVMSYQAIRKSMMYKINDIRETHVFNIRERRLAAFRDRPENSVSPVGAEGQSRTNSTVTVGSRNPIWTSFYMKEYNLHKYQ